MPYDYDRYVAYLEEVGATRLRHTDGDFLLHLTGVYEELKRRGRPEDETIAGLFHSVYGTYNFDVAFLPLDRRDEVRELIGERAERFVYVFCAVAWSSFAGSVLAGGPPVLWDRFADVALPVDDEEWEALLWMRLVNMLEVDSRVPYHRDHRDRSDLLFFRVVAERLGPAAVTAWNELYGGGVRRDLPFEPWSRTSLATFLPPGLRVAWRKRRYRIR